MKRLFSRDAPWRPTRLALVVLAFSLAVSALIGITIILVGDFDETEIRVLATAGTLAGFSILSLPSLFHLERVSHKFLAWAGISSSLLLFAMVLSVIWSTDIIGGETFGKILVSIGVTAFAINHILLMLIATPEKIFVSVCQWLTVGVISIVGVLILSAIWWGGAPEMMMRLFGALGVLDALGTVAVPILVRISRSS